MNVPLLQLIDLRFAYQKDEPLLRGIDLALWPEECLAITGHNGCGKSTLFRCITGLEKIGGGRIILDGREIKTERDFTALRRQIGYALQNSEDQLFFPEVMDDARFGPLNLGYDMDAATAMANEAFRKLGIEHLAAKMTDKLSGGEQKLAAMAGIFAMRPKVLLLDEPFNGLDNDNAGNLLRALQNSGAAKIIITHDPDFIRPLHPGYFRLENGRLRKVF